MGAVQRQNSLEGFLRQGRLTQAQYFSVSPDKASALLYQARNYSPDANHRLTNTSLIWGDYYLLEALLTYDAGRR